jgi:manganese/iron transport system permease protein/iron/zinc/copper transport system permease protein
VAADDLLLLAGALLFAAVVFTVGYRSFLFSSFDPEVAAVSGVRLRTTESMLMVVLSLSILATLQIIGVTLVAATLVIPAVVARMSSDSFSRMLWISTSLGSAAGAVGMYLSWYLEVPSGTTIVLVNALAFVVVLAVTGGRSLRRAAGLDDHAPTRRPPAAGRRPPLTGSRMP